MRFARFGSLLVALVVLLIPLTLAAPAASYADSYSWTAAGSAGVSYNWAGYVSADESSRYTAVSAGWVVPTVSGQEGSDLSADATWVGIGGVVSDDLIQAGTQALVDDSGDTQYEAWYEVLPDASAAVPLQISAGDSVKVSLAEVSEGEWQISFDNMTTGKKYTQNVAYDSSLSSAEWIQEMPSTVRGRSFIALDNFNTVAFSDASVIENGTTESLSRAGASPLNMVNIAGETLAEASALSSAGSGFAVMRTSAVASAPDTRSYHRQHVTPQLPF